MVQLRSCFAGCRALPSQWRPRRVAYSCAASFRAAGPHPAFSFFLVTEVSSVAFRCPPARLSTVGLGGGLRVETQLLQNREEQI